MSRIERRQHAKANDVWGASLDPVVKRVYAGRGITCDADLDLSLEGLHPVGSLDGITAAVDVLLAALRRRDRVIVVGDFDADGATSTALVVRALRRLGFADVDFVVPNRFEYGYGLTPEIVALVAQRAPGLIVTVDNGISSAAGVEAARRRGIEVLITDHHLAPADLPQAAAILNPNLPGSGFASRALAGVGVAFYLMAALARELARSGLDRAADRGTVAALLDLVALGTVADLVPLDRNNRILVHQGLRRIRAGRTVPGIKALLAAAGRDYRDAQAADLGYQVGPRLNAAGRLDDMTIGIHCLLTDDAAEASRLAGRLSQLNRDRRALESRMNADALELLARLAVDEPSLPLGVCLHEPAWHQGVVGLVAARVKDRLHRPVVAFATAPDGLLKGSARSVRGVHIRDVLDAIAVRHPGVIAGFGGHAMAAGLSLRAARFEEFSAAFSDEVARWMTLDDARGVVQSDGALAAGELTLATAEALRAAGPWGQAFPEPVFDGHFEVTSSRIVGERHLKLGLQTPDGAVCEAIAFRYFDADDAVAIEPAQRIEAAYRLDANDYGGTRRLQLVIEHIAARARSQ
jgi:single-stranded-DNA-specific exonuclease